MFSLLLLSGCGKAAVDAAPTAPVPQETHLDGTIEIQGEEAELHLSYYPLDKDTLQGELTLGDQTIRFETAGARLGFLDGRFQIADVNKDGRDDVLVDRGFVAEKAYAGCYVQQQDGSFLPVIGFDTLELPFWSKESKFLVVPQQLTTSVYCINHYTIEGNRLFPFERLLSDYTSGPLYSIEKMEKGEWIRVSENLTEANVDLDYWYLG